MKTYFFVVLGMHRSGTSFITRYLNVCGVYLGRNLMPYDQVTIFNPKGNWENKDFYKLAEQLLEDSNGKWHEPPSKVVCSKELKNQFENEFRKLIYDSHLSAGLKDPRTLLILDSIIDVLPENKLFVGIFRHPLKVAESLKTRQQFDYEKSINLWQVYNKKLLSAMEKNGGFLFDFDWSKERMSEEFEKFVHKTGLIDTNLDSVYSEVLFRSDKTYDKNYKLPQEVQELYVKLKEMTKINNSIEINPISFTVEESRRIMEKMVKQINELSEVRKVGFSQPSEDTKKQTLFKKLRKKFKVKH